MDNEVGEAIDRELSREHESLDFSCLPLTTITEKLNRQLLKAPLIISLDLKNCGLTTLVNFPILPNLLELDLSRNSLKGDSLVYLKDYQDILRLELHDNLIENLADFEHIRGLKELLLLSIEGNPVEETPDVRKALFSMFSTLKILDNKDCDNGYVEVSYDSEAESEPEESDRSSDGGSSISGEISRESSESSEEIQNSDNDESSEGSENLENSEESDDTDKYRMRAHAKPIPDNSNNKRVPSTIQERPHESESDEESPPKPKRVKKN